MNEDGNCNIGWRKELLEKDPEKLKEGSSSKSGHYRKLSSTSDSSKSSSSSLSSGNENSSDSYSKDAGEISKKEKKLLKKKMHKEEKHLKRDKKKLEKIQRREMKKAKKETKKEEKQLKKLAKKSKHSEPGSVDCSIPIDLMYSKAKAPETKEYEVKVKSVEKLKETAKSSKKLSHDKETRKSISKLQKEMMNEDENCDIGWRKELLEKDPKKLKEGSCSKSGHYRKLSSTSDSSKSSSSSLSSGSENSSDSNLKDGSEKSKKEKKLLKKKMHKEEKHLRREKKKLEKIQRREMKKAKKEKRKEEKKLKKLAKKSKHSEPGSVDCSIPIDLMYSKAKAPETKEEYEARQSRIRREVDPVTGRTRLIKGDGEVLEEIVSRDRHKEINKQATEGDGNFFQTKTVGWNVPL